MILEYYSTNHPRKITNYISTIGKSEERTRHNPLTPSGTTTTITTTTTTTNIKARQETHLLQKRVSLDVDLVGGSVAVGGEAVGSFGGGGSPTGTVGYRRSESQILFVVSTTDDAVQTAESAGRHEENVRRIDLGGRGGGRGRGRGGGETMGENAPMIENIYE